HVFAYKYQSAIAFSSWAFFLLSAPVLIAYGIIYGAPWPFYFLVPLFFLGFVLLPGSLGALISLLVVNLIPKQRKQVLLVSLVLLAAIAGLFLYSAFGQAMRPDLANRDALHQLMGWFTFAQGPLVPSHWMTAGFQAAARGYFGKAGYYLALVWSNGLAMYLLSAWTAKH